MSVTHPTITTVIELDFNQQTADKSITNRTVTCVACEIINFSKGTITGRICAVFVFLDSRNLLRSKYIKLTDQVQDRKSLGAGEDGDENESELHGVSWETCGGMKSENGGTLRKAR